MGGHSVHLLFGSGSPAVLRKWPLQYMLLENISLTLLKMEGKGKWASPGMASAGERFGESKKQPGNPGLHVQKDTPALLRGGALAYRLYHLISLASRCSSKEPLSV